MRTLLSLVIVALCLSACGGDTTQTPDSETFQDIPAPASRHDITTTVSEAGLTTMARLLEESGLGDTLRGEGPYTLFAPNDEAFATLADGGLDARSQEERLAILRYHIIPGRFETSTLAGSMDVNTLEGGMVTFVVEGASATVVDSQGNTAILTESEMNVDNGVIHVIDRVLMPATQTTSRRVPLHPSVFNDDGA